MGRTCLMLGRACLILQRVFEVVWIAKSNAARDDAWDGFQKSTACCFVFGDSHLEFGFYLNCVCNLRSCVQHAERRSLSRGQESAALLRSRLLLCEYANDWLKELMTKPYASD